MQKKQITTKNALYGDSNRNRLWALSVLVEMYIRLGKNQQAIGWLKKLKEIKEADLNEVFNYLSGEQRWNYTQETSYFDALAVLNMTNDLAEAVLRFKGVGIASMIEDRRLSSKLNDNSVEKLWDEVVGLDHEINNIGIQIPISNSGKQEELRKVFTIKNLQKNQVRKNLLKLLYGNVERRPILEVNIRDIRSNLDTDTALIDYIIYCDRRACKELMDGGDPEGQRFGAVIFTRMNDPVWVPLGSAKEIIELINRSQPIGNNRIQNYEQVLQDLHKKLIRPLLEKLPKETQTLIISPDANLNNLSFATLLTDENRFLCEEYNIKYITSGRDIITGIVSGKPDNARLYAFANPTFGETQERLLSRSERRGETQVDFRLLIYGKGWS